MEEESYGWARRDLYHAGLQSRLHRSRVKEGLCWGTFKKICRSSAQPEDATLGFSPNATSKISDPARVVKQVFAPYSSRAQ